MPPGSPAIACIGVIGKHDNPLHISLFPPEERDSLEFQFLLHTSLDIFHARATQKSADHDFGLLQAIDERLAMFGWLTNTGVKFVIVVDMEGKPTSETQEKDNLPSSWRNSDLKPAFRALHTAYIRLLRNPFFNPDDLSPHSANAQRASGSLQITSPMFIQAVERIGTAWYPGIQSL